MIGIRSVNRAAQRAVLKALDSWAVGHLTVELPDGSLRAFGRPDAAPRARVRIADAAFFRRFLLRGDMGVGESYTEGEWSADDLPLVLELALRNRSALPIDTGLSRVINVGRDLAHRLRPNTRSGSRRNIHAHYDLSNDFFSTFLDETMTYSAAVFESRDQPLAAAQRNKYRAVAEMAHLERGQRILEIGCGWGGFALFAAREHGCRVTGVTISREQHALACQRVAEAGLLDHVEIRLQDYREVEGPFDRVVSIEMFEALGYENWRTFFRKIDAVLAPNGLVVLQAITVPDHRFKEYLAHADWIQTYVFPGSVLASIAHMAAAAAEVSPLHVHHLEDIGIHYAHTLAHWRAAFLARLDHVRALGFDERFARLWDYYLAACQAAFATRTLSDVQIAFTRPANTSLPWLPLTARRESAA